MPRDVDPENVTAIMFLVFALQDALYSLVLDEITVKTFGKMHILKFPAKSQNSYPSRRVVT